ASTQLTIYAAWRLRGTAGALVGGACFIIPGLAVLLTLSTVFLTSHPPGLVAGAALGAGAAVPAVAVSAALGLLPASWRRAAATRSASRAAAPAAPATVRLAHLRWACYLAAGGAAAALTGPWLVLVLAACGLC